MENKNQYRKNTYGVQIVLIIATIAALIAVSVLCGVLIWSVVRQDNSAVTTATVADTTEKKEDTSAGEDTTADAVTVPSNETQTPTSDTTAPVEDTTSGESQGVASAVTFTCDLSAYEEYMNPTGENRDAYLMLVNVGHPLAADYIPASLVDVSYSRYDPAARMVSCAAKALEAMFLEMKAQGYTDVTVTSGYRSYATQASYFNNYVAKEMAANTSWTQEQAEAYVMTYSCRPGTSEHQSGLCCDMHNLPSADQSFAQKEAAQWLAKNCWKFGFILRFPENKTAQTGISYEPWHFRYVGRYHAEQMMTKNLCLEEYVASLGLA